MSLCSTSIWKCPGCGDTAEWHWEDVGGSGSPACCDCDEDMEFKSEVFKNEGVPFTNFHCLEVKYLGATNTLGSRVKITSSRFKQSTIISYDHALNNIEEMAAAYLEKHGFNILGLGSDLVITDTFKPLNYHPQKKDPMSLMLQVLSQIPKPPKET